jgi:L-methionine (R)-S-oxide reductase
MTPQGLNYLTEDDLLARLREVAASPEAKHRLPLEVVHLLKHNYPHYDWVGIYNLEADDTLVLGPFLGKPSPHTRIKTDSGICGAAVREEQTIIIDDVNADPRYLACSLETKSEIVVPIFKNGSVVGEIDIDSHRHAAFTQSDRKLLEEVAKILSEAY